MKPVKRPKPIYTVTVLMPSHSTWEQNRHRCWGWYPTLAMTKDAIKNNYGDMHENHYYRYAIIERVHAGVCGGGIISKQWWFEWTGEGDEVKRIDCPKEYEGICGWGLG